MTSGPRREQILIVGAGAAGLWAAMVAAERGARVLLLEKTGRIGTKILASGGGRCNLTTTLGPREAARLFRHGERFLRPAFRALPPQAVRDRFATLGVATVEEPELEKVFPVGNRAHVVRDALEQAARSAGVVIRLNAEVRSIRAAEQGGGPRGPTGWIVVLASGEEIPCESLLLCPGGMSYPGTGTTGDGYGWLRDLGLPVVPPVPALAPLSSPAAWVRGLSGLTLERCELRLLDLSGRLLGKRRRPLLFTHKGVSGPGPMDLSVQVARGLASGAAAPGSGAGPSDAPFVLAVDLVPDIPEDELRRRLIDVTQGGPNRNLRTLLDGPLPKRLLPIIADQAGFGAELPPPRILSKKQRNRLVDVLKGLRIPIDGTLGFNKAEVTAGGLALEAVDPRTMEVRGHPGLYVFGELLDLDGPIGGFSFQAAFATAELAACAASASS